MSEDKSTPRLLPCPFCGGEAEVEQTGSYRQTTIYACGECGCRLETGEVFKIGQRWNTREPLNHVDALVKALEPFAKAWEAYGDKPTDDVRLADNNGGAYLEACLLTFADLRAAADALASYREGKS